MIHNGIDYPYIDRVLLSEEQIEEINEMIGLK